MLASSTCVYVDKRLSEDLGGLQIQGAGSTALGDAAARPVLRGHELTAKIDRQMEELRCNIKTLLSEFEHGEPSPAHGYLHGPINFPDRLNPLADIKSPPLHLEHSMSP